MNMQIFQREPDGKEMKEIQQQQIQRTRKLLTPRADIYESGDAIIVLADMPGVDEKGIEVTLEKNVLTVEGFAIGDESRAGYTLTYSEYAHTDYKRVFILPDEVDRDKIVATVKHGLLKLTVPKSVQAKARRISVTPS